MGRENLRFDATKMSIEQISDGIARALYRKPLKECLGEKQNLQTNKYLIKDKYFHMYVFIPKEEQAKYWKDYNQRRHYGYVRSMLKHAKKTGVNMVVRGFSLCGVW